MMSSYHITIVANKSDGIGLPGEFRFVLPFVNSQMSRRSWFTLKLPEQKGFGLVNHSEVKVKKWQFLKQIV